MRCEVQKAGLFGGHGAGARGWDCEAPRNDPADKFRFHKVRACRQAEHCNELNAFPR